MVMALRPKKKKNKKKIKKNDNNNKAYLDSDSSSIPEPSVHLAKAPLTQQGPQLHILKSLILPCLYSLLHTISTPV